MDLPFSQMELVSYVEAQIRLEHAKPALHMESVLFAILNLPRTAMEYASQMIIFQVMVNNGHGLELILASAVLSWFSSVIFIIIQSLFYTRKHRLK